MVSGYLLFAPTAPGGSGHGHDHSEHDHGKASPSQVSSDSASSDSASSVDIDASRQSELGIEIAEVPTRKVGDGSDEVSALPKASVFTQGGKHYVFAIPDGVEDRFERWGVTLGESDDFFFEIKTGVFPGDRIVIAGVSSIRQLENSAKALTHEAEETKEAAVDATELPSIDDSARTSPEPRPSSARPLPQQTTLPQENRSPSFRIYPDQHGDFRPCDLVETWHFDCPQFQDHEFDHFAPPCYEVYRNW